MLLLEIIDLRERAKSPYHRDRNTNSESGCLACELENYTILSYPPRYKGLHQRPKVVFRMFKN